MALLGVAAGVAVCGQADKAANEPTTAPSAQAIADLLRSAPAGWEITHGPIVYNADNLWEWIDGEAEDFLEYRFSFAVAAVYSKPDLSVEVGVFVMQTPLDAFGVFSRQRTEESRPGLFPNASFWEDTQVHVWRNYAYIRFIPSAEQAASRLAVRKLAEAVIEPIGPAKTIPALLRILPAGNMVRNTLQFRRRNVLGQDFLRNGAWADYRTGEHRLTLLVLDCGGAKQAGQTLSRLSSYLGCASQVPMLGQAALSGASKVYGSTLTMRQGRYVAAVLHAQPRDFAIALLRRVSVNVRIVKAGGAR